MDKFVKSVLRVICFTLLGIAVGFMCPVQGEAENSITVKVGGRNFTLNSRTPSSTKAKIVNAIRSGHARIEVRNGKGNKRVFSLKSSRPNTKNLEIVEKILSKLVGSLTVEPGPSDDNNQVSTVIEPPRTFVTVFKAHTVQQCDNVNLSALDGDLTSRGVTISGSYCAIPSDKTSAPLDCGKSAVMYRMHTIERSQGARAMAAGYAPMEWLKVQVTRTDCNRYGDKPIEMVGTITNVACRTTQNTVEAFDAMLESNGLKILGSSCGVSNLFTIPSCDIPEVTYRLVKVWASNRNLALRLGLVDRQDYGQSVRFGEQCPPFVIIDPPTYVEMVGVISNVVCNPPENTVAAFDAKLVSSGLNVISSRCAYSKTPQPDLPCRDVYRAVLITSSQQAIAVALGLFNVETVFDSIKFVSSCPQ